MAEKHELRLMNLRNLINEAGGATELAKIIGYKNPSYLYQLLNKTVVQNGKYKNIGDNLARKLEEATGKEKGWMDIPHNIVSHNINYTNYGNHNQGNQTIHGYCNTVSQAAARASQTMPDNSMAPVIPQGSEVWIDDSQSVQDGKIYLVEWGGLSLIRRLFKRPNDTLRLGADNPQYGEDTVEAQQVQIKGRVVKWCVSD